MAALKKERIKDQMVNTAARIWGINENEIEQNADPLAILLIEACAAELEKIGYSISESHVRLLENLSDVMLPESMIGAMPASGIIQALPIEESCTVDPLTIFSSTQKIFRSASNTTETVDMHLAPVANYKLFKTELAYLVLGNKMFFINENNRRELLDAANDNLQETWIAIKMEKMPDNLNGLNIFFDLRSHSAATKFYNAISYSKCFINDKLVSIFGGSGIKEDDTISQKEILLSANGKTNKLNRKISQIYQHHFLQIKESGKINTISIPDSWQKRFNAEILKKIEAEKLVFIRFEFNQVFSQDVYDAIACNINAFPVVNKKLNSYSYKTDEWLNIIPLPDKGTYFDLESVKNEKAEKYKIRPFVGSNDISAGEVIVRSSGVGKTCSPDVREMIGNITENIRGQSAYFGQISNEVILSKLREIGKILTGLEDNIHAATDKKPQVNYLMLRPHKKGEMIFIEYWTTNDSDANNIKSGSAISSINTSIINTKKSFTVTGFSGGKSTVSDSEKKVMLRQQLLSGGKIISAEDVKLMCMQLYGNKLKSIKIQKGVQVGANATEGFKRTIDVILTYSNHVNESMQLEMENLQHELEYILKKDTSPVYPFRIIISK